MQMNLLVTGWHNDNDNNNNNTNNNNNNNKQSTFRQY